MGASPDTSNLLFFPGVTSEDVARGTDRPNAAGTDGWHRGVLAGLSEDERELAIRTQFLGGATADDIRADHRKQLADDLGKQAAKHEPTTSLAEALALHPKAELERLARILELTGVSKLNKAALAARIAEALPARDDLMASDLTTCSPDRFDALMALVDNGPATFDTAVEGPWDRTAHAYLSFPPYIHLFKQGTVFTALVPDEMAAALRTFDRAEIAALRTAVDQVLDFAETAATYYGLIALDQAYLGYRELFGEGLDPVDFAGYLYRASLSDEKDFELVERDDQVYIAHYLLTDAYAVDTLPPEAIEAWDRNGKGFADGLADDIDAALQDLDAYRDFLIERHAERDPRPLDGLVRANAFDGLFDLPEAVALRNHFDAHVPDDENDYAYADVMMETVLDVVYEGARLPDLVDALRDEGAFACTDDPQALVRLATNLYDALPSWELNGWSPRELRERSTGQRTFYNPDGTVRKVGRNEPCPCGSGKKYKNCCGRGARA